MYMGIWSHERYISKESEVGSLQSTDALSGHVDVTQIGRFRTVTQV